MQEIQFEYSEDVHNRAVDLEPGRYIATVEVLTTEPQQYRVFNIKHADGKDVPFPFNQLLLFRNHTGEKNEWREILNNVSNDLVAIIGKELDILEQHNA